MKMRVGFCPCGLVLAALLGGCASVSDRAADEELARAAGRFGASQPAVSELPANAGLEDYLGYAEQNNPGLQAAYSRWKAALEAVPQARALPDPMFSYMIEGQGGVDMQTFMMSQTFPWLGKRGLRAAAAADAAQAELHRYEAEKLALFFRVKDAYYEYYYLGRAVGVTRDNMTLLTNLEKVLEVRYKVAAAEHADLIRIQVELGKLDNELRTMETMQAPAIARLNATLNRPATATLPWPATVKETPAEFKDEQLLAWAAESNPELRSMTAEIGQQEKKIELARKAYYPDPTLGLGFNNRDKTMQMGMDTTFVSIGFNLPIWFPKLSAGVREARWNHLAAWQQRAEKANAIAADVQMLAWRFRDAHRRIGLYRDTLVPKGIEALKTTQKAFEAGKASFADFIDAQRMLLEFQLSYERALADREQRLAELEALIGRPITRPVAGPAEKE